MATDKTLAKATLLSEDGDKEIATEGKALIKLLKLAEAVKPEVTEEEKALVVMLSHLDKNSPARPILEDQLSALQSAASVDPIEAIKATAEILGKPLANAVSVAIRKLAGDRAHALTVKVAARDGE